MTSKHDPSRPQRADSMVVSRPSEALDSSPLTAAPNAENMAPRGVCPICHKADCPWFTLVGPLADSLPPHPADAFASGGGLNPRQRDALGGFFERGYTTTQQAVDRAVNAARPRVMANGVYADVIAPKLAGWIAHSRQEGSIHVSIPLEVADAIHTVLRGVSAASAPEIFVRDPRAALTGDPAAVTPGPPPVTDDSSLNRAVQTAARDLPIGFLITVNVEKDSGWVEVDDDLSDFHHAADGLGITLSEQIAECVDHAIKEASRLGRPLS